MTGCQNTRQISRSRITSVLALTSTWLPSFSLPRWQVLFVAAFLFTYFAVRKEQNRRNRRVGQTMLTLTDGFQVFQRSCSKQRQGKGFIFMMDVLASTVSAVATMKSTEFVHIVTTSGGTRLMQKWLCTSVALAIIPVRPMVETHVGLARAAVVASRPIDPWLFAFVL